MFGNRNDKIYKCIRRMSRRMYNVAENEEEKNSTRRRKHTRAFLNH